MFFVLLEPVLQLFDDEALLVGDSKDVFDGKFVSFALHGFVGESEPASTA